VKRRFDFHPRARAELRHAVQFYEAEARGLGAEFAAEVRTAIDQVLEYPESGSPARAGTRRRLLGRFPYSLIYLPELEILTIVALMHHRREPDYWLDRLP
jgi:plasmid stabilization system protein ParE